MTSHTEHTRSPRGWRLAALAMTAAAAIGVSLVVDAPSASAGPMGDLGSLLDLSRPELSAVATELGANDEAGAAVELADHFATRTGLTFPVFGPGGDATADEIADGTFRFGPTTRAFGSDIDWEDLWDGTSAAPGPGQGLMRDFAFMGTLSDAYLDESPSSPLRAEYAAAWMRISLDYITDNPTFSVDSNLTTAKRLTQMVGAFSVFRTESTIDPDDLVIYLTAVHAMANQIDTTLETHFGNNWFVSMARALYVTAVYVPEFKRSHAWETYAMAAAERFMRVFMKGDGVYREPTFNYQAYVVDLLNFMMEVGESNGRTMPRFVVASADALADVLFATRTPEMEIVLVGDSSTPSAGRNAISEAASRNGWTDFTWVATERATGTTPALGGTLFPLSYAVQRSGWDSNARYLLVNNQDSSYTSSHRHPDDLSIAVSAYGRPLIVDPGVGDYYSSAVNDWMRRTTTAHNTIEVDGQPQQANTSANRVARSTLTYRTNEGLDLYRGSGQGYKPLLHDRAVYFVKPGYWIVSDAITGSTGSHDYRQLWHFPGDTVSVDPLTNTATVGFGADAGIQIVPVAPPSGSVSSTIHDDGAVRVGANVLEDVEYLSYDWSSSSATTGLDAVLIPGAAGAAPAVSATRISIPSVAHSVATALEIDLPSATGRFYLSREAVPSSRSFGSASTNAETAYLETNSGGTLTRYAVTRGTSLVDGGDTIVSASATVSDLSVAIVGTTADVSLATPFDGTLTINAPVATVVELNGSSMPFTRSGDLVTINVTSSLSTSLVLDADFNSVDPGVVYTFESGLEGWGAAQGTWVQGGSAPDKHLAQTSSANAEAFAALTGTAPDIRVTAAIAPGTRSQTTARTGIAIRYQNVNNHYRAEVVNTAGVAQLRLVKRANGTDTILTQADLAITGDAAHSITVTSAGSRLSASVDGGTPIVAGDAAFPSGAVAAYTHRRAATFDDVNVAETIASSDWVGVSGGHAIESSRLVMQPVSDWSHVLAHSTSPARMSTGCDAAAQASITLTGAVGAAGLALRDGGDGHHYRISVGKTSGGSRYVNILRLSYGSGATAAPVVIASASLSDPLTGAVTLRAEAHGDRIRVSFNGVQVLEARDTVLRSGGVGLVASTGATFDDVEIWHGQC